MLFEQMSFRRHLFLCLFLKKQFVDNEKNGLYVVSICDMIYKSK